VTSVKTYTNISGETLPVPPLEELRVKDWASLPRDRYVAVEAWWIHADHPGFGLSTEHTMECMRDAGFPETEIQNVLMQMLLFNGEEPEPEALTNALAHAVQVADADHHDKQLEELRKSAHEEGEK
jgi:hypothetical protein